MRRVFVSIGLVVAFMGAVLAQGQPAQAPAGREQPAVTFKLEVNYVEVDAIVTDAQGHLARGLTKDDFQVLEDGKPQSISVFSLVDIPIERAERPLYKATPIERDVQSNARPFNGRVYVLVLDDLHTAPLRSALVRRAAREFVERYIGANDMTAVLETGGRADAAQDFTSNRGLLLDAIGKFMGQKLRSPTLNKLEQYSQRVGMPNQNDRLTDPEDFERGYKAESSLSILKNLANWMAGIRGRRKAVVYFSEGIDYDIRNPFDNPYATTILTATRDVIAAATRANVNIYAVDPRGLTALGDESIELQSVPNLPNQPGLGTTSLYDELRLSQDSLRVLADETGGFASVSSNDFTRAFSRIVRESSTYYVLGYYPTNEKRNGKFRKLEVRVTRPGYTVKARRGYVAPKGKPEKPAAGDKTVSAALRDALASPLPVSGLTLDAFAAPFKGAEPDASVLVAVEVPGTDFAFAEHGGRFVDDLEMSMQAIDQAGKIRGGDHNAIKLDLRPETHASVLQHGVRFLSRVSLPPGHYQLRIAAHEQNASRVGSVLYDLVVPDFTDAPLMMSGLVVTSAAAARTPTPKADPETAKVLPAPPTTARSFAAGDALALFTEVYDNKPRTPHGVDITASVLADDGHVVYKTEDVRQSSELGGTRGGYGYTAEIPLKDMAPGIYVLRVEARSRLGGDPVTREVQFRVVDAAARVP
jgi:VWFA-related protein